MLSKVTNRIQTKIETIGPAKAAKYLESNINNRKLNDKHVRLISTDMLSGNFVLNGDAIRFDSNGCLVDGQHRLNAVIRANVAIETIVIRGLKPESFQTIDGGRKRTPSDFFGVDGKRNVHVMSAVLRQLIGHENSGNRIEYINSGASYTNVEVLQAEKRYPELEPITADVCGRYKTLKRWIPASLIVFIYFKLSSIDVNCADSFFDSFESGEGLKKGDPVYALRQKLMTDATLVPNNHLTKKIKTCLVIKSWNAYRTGKSIKMLRTNSNDCAVIAV